MNDQGKLLVLIINDMVIFPNNEVRVEYDNNYDKQMIDIVNQIEDNLMIIVNPIDNSNIDVTSFPTVGVLGNLKLKMNVPNGKTRIVIEGIERVSLSSIVEDGYFFRADYDEVDIEEEVENHLTPSQLPSQSSAPTPQTSNHGSYLPLNT